MSAMLHPAIVWLTARQLLAPRRALPVLALVAFPVAIAVAFRIWGGTDPPPSFYSDMMAGLVVGIVVPLIALLLGGTAFGRELEDGTAVFLLARPIPRFTILLSKAIVAVPVVALASAATALGAGLVLFGRFDGERIVAAATIACGAGGALYTLLFLAVGLVTRRGVLFGLIYLALWEGMLASAFAGTRLVSIRQYVLSFAARLASDTNAFAASLTLSTALWMSAAMAAASVLLALHRLRTFEVAASE